MIVQVKCPYCKAVPRTTTAKRRCKCYSCQRSFGVRKNIVRIVSR